MKLKENIKRIFTGLILIFSLTLMVGCEKDFNEPQKPEQTPVNVSFNLKMDIKEKPMTKGFDINTWVYNYNPNQFELKLSNNENTYTKMVSVEELKNGSVSINMLKGTYQVSFITTHQTGIGQYLDIKIDEEIYINGGGITLNGIINDFLIIVDIPNILSSVIYKDIVDATNLLGQLNFNSVGGFWWGYLEDINYNILRINWTGDLRDNYNLDFVENGNVYIYLRPSEHQTTIIIPELPVNKIVI